MNLFFFLTWVTFQLTCLHEQTCWQQQTQHGNSITVPFWQYEQTLAESMEKQISQKFNGSFGSDFLLCIICGDLVKINKL